MTRLMHSGPQPQSCRVGGRRREQKTRVSPVWRSKKAHSCGAPGSPRSLFNLVTMRLMIPAVTLCMGWKKLCTHPTPHRPTPPHPTLPSPRTHRPALVDARQRVHQPRLPLPRSHVGHHPERVAPGAPALGLVAAPAAGAAAPRPRLGHRYGWWHHVLHRIHHVGAPLAVQALQGLRERERVAIKGSILVD